MAEIETIYSSPISPDVSNAREVLAFLLVRPEVLIDPDDGPEVAEQVRVLLADAKREALLAWYRTQTKGMGR